MVLELLRALLASVVVAGVPGWFWAGLLAGDASRAERVVYSMGLSLALVPAVALVPARMFGLGVTLPVTIFAVAFVFVTGFLAASRFGPFKKAPTRPVLPPPTSPGLPALALLLPAFVVALLTAYGGLSERQAFLPIAILLVFAGTAHFVETRRLGDAGSQRPGLLSFALLLPALLLAVFYAFGDLEGTQALRAVAVLLFFAGVVHLVDVWKDGRNRAELSRPTVHEVVSDDDDGAELDGGFARGRFYAWLRGLSLPVVLALALVRGYSGPIGNEWPFVRGVDTYSHVIMARLMMEEGTYADYLIYPPGLHTTTALVSRISGLEPLDLFEVLAPAMFVLPVFSLYVLGRRLWGHWAGISASAIGGLVMHATYRHYEDGMYPHHVAAQFLLVLAVAAFFVALTSPSWRSGLLFALLGASVPLFHQVGALYGILTFALLALSVPLLLLRREDRRAGVVLFGAFALLGTLAVAYVWDTYDLNDVVAGLFVGSAEESATGSAISQAFGTQKPRPLDHVIDTISEPVTWLGIVGLLMLLAEPLSGRGAGGHRVGARFARFFIVAWTLVMFSASRIALSGWPTRFERDVGLPLSLVGAFVLVALLRPLAMRGFFAHRQVLTGAVATGVAVLAVALVGFRAQDAIEEASRGSHKVKITPEIAAAGEWLREHNDGTGSIVVAPAHNQMPSRVVLALSDYSALQSYELRQLNSPRDLPPYGPQPLYDQLTILTHPASQTTQGLLDKYDVRYIVFFRDFPGRESIDFWRKFDGDHPERFQTVFDNGQMLIVQPLDYEEPVAEAPAPEEGG